MADGGRRMPGRAPTRTSRRRALALLAVAPVSTILLGGGSDNPRPETTRPYRLRIATGSPGAVYYAYGQAIAELIRADLPAMTPEVLVTAASAENAQLLTAGHAEVGFMQADVAASSWDNHPTVRLAAIARLYDDYLHLVVAGRSPVTQLQDLPAASVSLGPAGSGTEVTARRLLTVAGIDPDRDLDVHRLDLQHSIAAMRAGRIDAFFFSGGLPVTAVSGLAAELPIRLLDLGGWTSALRQRHGESYLTRDIPASVYGTQRITTVAVANYLVVRDTLPDPQAFALARLLIERRSVLARAHPAAQRMNRRVAISTHPLPLHAGAARYYRESKI